MKSPVSKLSPRMSIAWSACAIGGPFLSLLDVPSLSKVGAVLMLLSLGYMLFGLGLQENVGPTGPTGSAEESSPSGEEN